MTVSHADITSFWFAEAGPKDWFKKSDAFDALIRQRFEEAAVDIAASVSKAPHLWEASPDSTLALIIVLDQFPRNMYRDTPAAFGWDAHALGVSKRMIEKGWDLKVPQDRRSFIYMPFMHSEKLSNQDRCVALMESRLENEDNVKHAVSHRNLIERFGRFPHRNTILGRTSRPEEIEFLENGGYAP